MRHEASRLRKQSERHRSLEQPLSIDGRACLGDVLADARQLDFDEVLGVLDALRVAKPDHARALIARALGWRYREIAQSSQGRERQHVTQGHSAVADMSLKRFPSARVRVL